MENKQPQLRGRWLTDEEKQRLSISKSEWWKNATPEQRERHARESSQRMKNFWKKVKETKKMFDEQSKEIAELERQLERARSGTKIYLPAKKN